MEFLFFLLCFISHCPPGWSEVISASLLFGIICHSYKQHRVFFLLEASAVAVCERNSISIVGWKWKGGCPQLNQQTWQVFLWVRGVTCCLNFHASLISSVSQWTWHLLPLKNGIMNLSLSPSLSVRYTCTHSIVYSTTNLNTKESIVLQPRGAGNSTLVSWRVIFSLCAFLCKPSALWRLHCQIPHGSSAFRTVWPSNTHVFASSSRVSPAQTAISPDPAEYFRFKRACLPDLGPALCCLAVCSGSSQWLLESRSDTKC